MKPTQQEIIELAREAGANIYTSAIVPNSIPEISFVPLKLERFATLLLERFGAGSGEPVAKCVQCKKEYRHGKTGVGCPKCAPGTSVPESEFAEPITSHLSPDSLRAEYERGLDDAAKAFASEADTWKAWAQAGAAKRKGLKAIEALKGR